MIGRIEHMFDTHLDDLGPDATLAYAATAQRTEDQARVAVLRAAARWADLHGDLDRDAGGRVLPGAERLVAFGGDGTPEAAEFCGAELGTVLSMSPSAAAVLIGDALDLRHRLPALWSRIQAGEVRAWVGQQAAQATRRATLATTLEVDHRVAKWAHSLPWGRLAKIIDATLIDADPDRAAADAAAARSQHGVWVSRSTQAGSKDIHIRTDTPSAIWFDATIARIADTLTILGNTDTLDQRRAAAVGIIAQPQTTLNLFHDAQAASSAGAGRDTATGDNTGLAADAASSRSLTGTTGAGRDTGCGTGTGCGKGVDPRPPVTLYIHLNQAALTGDTQVARLEGIGPILKDQVRGWLRHCEVTVKPVIDLNAIAPADAYETPPRIREAVHLRTPADCFPYATNTTTRTHDLDHTVPYVARDKGGPAGQTSSGNLGPMTRRHHRIKTFSSWKVTQPFDGIFAWTSPRGRVYLTGPTGTHPIQAPS
jgi:hypothetical protein